MTMTSLKDLAVYAKCKFPAGYPVEDHIVLHAPEDNLLGALAFFTDSAESSLVLSLPGFDHDALKTAILRKLQEPEVYVQLYLRDSDYNGTRALFLDYAEAPGNNIAKDYEPGDRHLFSGTADGLDSFSGSARSLTFARHPLITFRTRTIIDLAHNAARQRGE